MKPKVPDRTDNGLISLEQSHVPIAEKRAQYHAED
jgi:hypothetical protein